MKKFEELDIYKTDALYSEEERMVKETVRDFVTEKVLPIIAHHYQAGTFPTELIPQIAELGLMGANLKGYGCAEMNNVAYGLCMQELERGDSGIRSFVSVQGALCMYPIHAFGSDAQKDKYLPKMAKGELIGCFGLTEPDHGSDPGGMKSRCRKKGDGWVINGNKYWITNANQAHLAIVWAKDEEGVVQGFIVDAGTKGFRAEEIKGKLSLRASDTGGLVLEDCEVSEEQRLPNTSGLKSALMCLTQARYGIGWGGIGAALACFDEAREYAKTRIMFNGPIARFQLVQNKLAHIATEITKGQLLNLQLGRLKDQGKMHHTMVSVAKRNNVWVGLEAARTCRDILGASGILDEYQSMRHACNLESVYTYEGTHDIHTLIIGEHVTGIPAFK